MGSVPDNYTLTGARGNVPVRQVYNARTIHLKNKTNSVEINIKKEILYFSSRHQNLSKLGETFKYKIKS